MEQITLKDILYIVAAITAIISFITLISKPYKLIKEKIGEIVYYNRYVDDIIIIIHPTQVPKSKKPVNKYKCIIEVIFNSIFIMGIITIILLIAKRKRRKDIVPFAPAILIAVLVTGLSYL